MLTNLQQFVPAAYVPGFEAPAIEDLYIDSRDVMPGTGFVALRGSQSDGRAFIQSAFDKGARIAFADTEGMAVPHAWREKVIHIPELEARIASMAADFYDHPSANMATVAVTGTNGKTSVACFVAAALGKLIGPCGYIGTLGWGVETFEPLLNTTPDVVSMHRLLAKMKAASARSAVFEASSIGIHQGRIDDVVIDVAVFTNLSRDHLDYHGDFASYAEVKRQLFLRPGLQAAVINVDDPMGAEWVKDIHADCRVITYGLKASADVVLTRVEYRLNGTAMQLKVPCGLVEIDVPVVGEYNAMNVMAACAVLCHYSEDCQRIAEALQLITGVPGRMELVGTGNPVVLVDYAHTPDGLESALQALRPHCQGRLIVVFGCGGDRDKGKRPQMAAVCESLADVLVVTSDNPRSEHPMDIIGDVLQGLSAAAKPVVQVDRRLAIGEAISLAGEGDCILIAGKGHEDYQIIGDQHFPFDDRQVAKAFLSGGEA